MNEARAERAAAALYPEQALGIATRHHMPALAERNAASLYKSLTPVVKIYYSDSNEFLNYLKTELKPLANARNYSFASIEREATDAVQDAVLTSTNGRELIARFKLQRQSDGRWAIAQCLIEAAPGPQTCIF